MSKNVCFCVQTRFCVAAAPRVLSAMNSLAVFVKNLLTCGKIYAIINLAKAQNLIFAGVAELADALVSGSSEAIHVGSSPVIRTKNRQVSTEACRFLFLHY